MTLPALARLRGWLHVHPIVGSSCIALGAFAIALPINILLDQVSPSRVFLVAVLISGITYGLWPSLFASLIAVLIYDFFFIPPLYSLTVASVEDLINLAFFAVTAVIVSTLAARVRRYAVTADRRALTAEKLAAFNRRVSAGVTLQDVLDTATEQISLLLARPVALLRGEQGGMTLGAEFPAGTGPDAACRHAVANWLALVPAPPGDNRFAYGAWRFMPVPMAEHRDLVVGIQAPAARPHFDSSLDDPLLVALTEQLALAFERMAIRERLEAARVHAEAERLRSALLASISHDLRNPLASIVGSASGLDQQWHRLSDDAKLALLDTIRGEAERLDVFIANLLDITRIEAGAVRPRREAVFVSEVLGAALSQAARPLAQHRLDIAMPADLPVVEADAGLLQQVLYNVIDNAAKYSPSGSLIRIAACAQDGTVQLRILDEGPGVPEAELELVFEKFYRAGNTARRAGTGLGLAICRGFLEAMHGTIEMANRDDRHGTVVAVTLPTACQPASRELETSCK